MHAFYELATTDYRELAAARDWRGLLSAHARGGSVGLLDVACGSGRFPTALCDAGLAASADLAIRVDLLDPSAFSIAEASAALRPPFVVGNELLVGIEQLAAPDEPYDVAWAVHALYAVAPDMLGEGLRRMHEAIRPGGLGVIAHATPRSHYLRVFDAYRAAHRPEATPYAAADRIVALLRAAGAEPVVDTVTYTTTTDNPVVAEGFLQRCLFDDTLTLSQMTTSGPHGSALVDYLDTCRQDNVWTFDHEVALITWQPDPAASTGPTPDMQQ